jgi:hypothetical protein
MRGSQHGKEERMFEGIKNAIAGKLIDRLQETPVTTENLFKKNKQGARIADLTGVEPNTLTETWEDKKGKVVRKLARPAWRNE